MGSANELDYAKINAVIRSLSDIPPQKKRKLLLGSFMVKVFPGRSKKLEANAVKRSWGAFDRMLRNGLLAHAYWEGNYEKQRALFAHYWEQEADEDAHVWQDRFEKEFLGHNVAIIDALVKAINLNDYGRLYEIGCGHGQVLQYLVNRLNGIDEFIGIDISEEQIKKNKEDFDHPKVEFHAGDAVAWIINNAQPYSIFLTNGGVFEYFLQKELESIFKYIIDKCSPAVIGIVETIGSDHNLKIEHNSLIYGREMAFSHNYPYLMQKAGLEVIYQSEQEGTKTHGGGRWIRVLGIAK